MTLLGKILVLVNFGLSVMVLVWAMALYFGHIDWTDAKGEPSKSPPVPPGELKVRKDRVSDAWAALASADASWRANRADLLEQETYRVADRAWYDAELKHARSGAGDKSPAREIALDKDKGGMVLDPADAQNPRHKRPRLKNATDDANQPLVSLDENLRREKQQRDDLKKAEKKLADLIEETNQQTELLTPEKGKGLRQRIEDEKVKIALADEELAIIKPLLVNTAVESELILRRRQMLEARIKELTGVGVVSGASAAPGTKK
jgi:hypothetical protein